MAEISSKCSLRSGLLCWAIVGSVCCALAASARGSEGVLRPDGRPACAYRDPLMDPTRDEWRGHPFVWAVPGSPRAILVLAHGDRMDPHLYFDPGPRCPACYGLPEGRRIVLDALRRGYAVIAVKSVASVWDSSWPPAASADVAAVRGVLKFWARARGLAGLPVVAWGHSAGGEFASALALAMPLRGLVLAVSGGRPDAVRHATPGSFPPTFFSYMFSDAAASHTSSAAVEAAMTALQERGVTVSGKMAPWKPLHPLFFADRIRCMTDAMSAGVYDALVARGWVDDRGQLSGQWGESDWMDVLKRALPPCADLHGDPCLSKDVRQELTVAEGVHGMTSDTDDELFSFLEINALQQRHHHRRRGRDPGRSSEEKPLWTDG